MAGNDRRRRRDGPPDERLGGRAVRRRTRSSRNAAPTDRLAQAFQALVPDTDRQRQLLALARDRGRRHPSSGRKQPSRSCGRRSKAMLTSYSDEKFVSDAIRARAVGARARAVDVEATSDDPPERVTAWLATVSDGALRGLDHACCSRSARHRGGRPRAGATSRETVITHAEDLVRVGYFDQALAARRSGRRPRRPRVEARKPHGARRARAARARRDDAARRRSSCASADDEGYERFKRLCARHRDRGDRAAGRSAVERTGRAVAAPAARHPRRVRRGRDASRCSS